MPQRDNTALVKQAGAGSQQRQPDRVAPRKDWNKIMFGNAMRNYGKFQDRPAIQSLGPERKMRPHPMQGQWESGYMDYLKGTRPDYISQNQPDSSDLHGIENWRATDFEGQFGQGGWGDWNGKEVVGPSGQKLPQGAMGWDVNGNAYFGNGYDAWKKKMAYRFKGDAALERPEEITTTTEGTQTYGPLGEQHIVGVDVFATLDNVSNWMMAGKTKEGEELTGGQSIFSAPLRYTGAVIAGVLDIFQAGAVGTKQTLSAMQEISDLQGTPSVRDDLNDSGYGAWIAGNKSPFIQAGMNFVDMVTSLQPQRIGAAIGTGLLTEPDDVWNAADRGWNAGHAYYTQVIDSTVRPEMERRWEAGEDPVLLAQALANPWAEMAGEMILDPANLIGAIAGKAAKAGVAKKVADDFVKVSDEIADALRVVDKFGEADALNQVEGIAQGMRKVVQNNSDAGKKIAGMAGEVGLRNPTADAKVFRVSQDTSEIFNFIGASTKNNIDDTAEALYAMWQIGGDNVDEVLEGSTTMSHLVDSMNPIFSRKGTQASWVVRKMFPDIQDARKMVEAADGDIVKLTTDVVNRMSDVLEDTFPTVVEIVAQRTKDGMHVPTHLRAMAKFHEKSRPFYRVANAAFAKVYMGLSPGYFMKNVSANTFQTMVDEGVGTFFRGAGVRGWLDTSLIDDDTARMLGGFWTPEGVKGFSGGGGASAGERSLRGVRMSEEAKSVGKRFREEQFAGLADVAEGKGASWVVNAAVRREMNSGLREGKALPTIKEMVEGGFSQDGAKHYLNILKDEWGDVDRATSRWLKEIDDTGTLDVFKNGTWLSDRQRTVLQDYGMYDDFMETAASAESLEEAVSMWDNTMDDFERIIAKVRNDPATMDIDGWTTEGTADFIEEMKKLIPEKSVQETVQHASWVGQANNEAVDAYQGAFTQAIRTHGHRVDVWDVKLKNGQTVQNTFRNPSMDKLNADVANMRKFALTSAADLRGKTVTSADMRRIWLKAGFEGDIPDGIKAKELARKIWEEYYYPNSQMLYRKFREEYVTGVEAVLGQLDIDDPRMILQARAQTNIARNWDNVQRSDQFLTRLRDLERGKDWMGVSETLLKKFGLKSKRSGSLEYMKNVLNKYGKKKNMIDGAAVPWTTDDIMAGKVRWDDLDEALIGRMANYSGMQSDWDTAEKIQKLGKREIDKFLDDPDVWYDVVEGKGKPGQFRIRMKGDSGRPIVVSDWGDDVDALKKEAVRNVLDDLYVTKRGDSGVFLTENSEKWKDLTGVVAKEAEEFVDEVAEVAEVAEGLKLTYDWQELPPNITVPAVPGIKIKVEDGKKFTRIDRRIRGAKALADDLPTIPYGKEMPSIPRSYAEQWSGLSNFGDEMRDGMKQNWGKVSDQHVNRNVNNTLQSLGKRTKQRVADLRVKAAGVGNEARKFTLLNYGEKRNFDTMLSYVMPYHFWYNRTYANWLKRAVQNPQVISAYAKYKSALTQAHAGQPDWWKNNISTDDLGINLKNPLFFNLEATLSPVYGLTGTDFNDPYKRVNGLTRLLDDASKFGPSLFTPISWAVAGGLYATGREEAASRWAGRIAPQTRTIKAGLNLMNVKWDSPGAGMNEVDPLVWFLSGGIDPYERNRVGRFAASRIDERPQDEAAIMDALYKQDGDLWNDMVFGAQKARAWPDIASYVAGVGFKGRTQQDMQIDIMDQEYRRMWAVSDDKGWEWTKNEMNRLNAVYPWMDTVILSRKHGMARDRAYAYSVLGRMPPGQKDDFFKANDADPGWYGKFYEASGDMTEWNENDAKRFMGFIVDAGAVLDFPDTATKAEWSDAQDYYKGVSTQMEERFGSDIEYLISAFYDLSDNKAAQEKFTQANPQVTVALSWRDGQIKNDPTASAYYMSASKLERYYNSFVKDMLDAEFPDIDFDLAWQGYFDSKMPNSPISPREYWDQHPELERSIELKDKAKEFTDGAYARAAANLRSPKFPDIRQPQGGEEPGFGQTQMREFLEGQKGGSQAPPEFSFTWQQWSEQMGPNLGNIVADYAYGEEIPEQAMDQLERLADRLDISVNVMLELMSESAQSRQSLSQAP